MFRRRKSLPGRWFPRVGLPLMPGAGLVVLFAALMADPLVLDRYHDPSRTVLSSDGRVLRAFMSGDDKWRLKTQRSDVDPLYLRMLIAYEDKRFFQHVGVDALAVLRAAGQAIARGRIVSGASTLTMQAARLAMPHRRDLAGKLREMMHALHIEARHGKDLALDMYLTLAPFGGPVEGVRAASWKLFGKEPRNLSAAQAALLVAIPQSPGQRGIGGNVDAARNGRDQVLRRVYDAGILTRRQFLQALEQPIPTIVWPMPFNAPHFSRQMVSSSPAPTIRTHIDHDLQLAMQARVAQAVAQLPGNVSIAALAVRNSDAAVLALASGGNMFDQTRAGMMDLTRAVRSPGSTLKPFIYALAFDRGIADPETLIQDRKTDFYGYQPGNFDGRFRGQVTIAEALQQSLNIPAVKVLDRLGPQRFTRALADAGLQLLIGDGHQVARLPIALGGAGTNLRQLVRGFAGLANSGRVAANLKLRKDDPSAVFHRLVSDRAADLTLNILASAPPPNGRVLAPLAQGARGRIAYKTGTSYRYRDAWSIGTLSGITIGVWVGQIGGGQCPGCSGRAVAAPVLFDLFDLPSLPVTSRRRARKISIGRQPGRRLQYFERPDLFTRHGGGRPEILFPQDGSEIIVRAGRGVPVASRGPVGRGGWLLNGAPAQFLSGGAGARSGGHLAIDGGGHHRVTLITGDGRTSSVQFTVHIEN